MSSNFTGIDCFESDVHISKGYVRLTSGLSEYIFGDDNGANSFNASVTFNLVGYNNSNSVLFASANKELNINNSPPPKVEDIYWENYLIAYPTLDKLELKVTNFTLTSNNIEISDSIYVDFFVTHERNILPYEFGNYEGELFQVVSPAPYSSSSRTITYDKPTRFEWKYLYNCKYEVPNWQLQILKLNNIDKSKAESNQDEITAIIDWDKSLTIETGNEKTYIDITLTEGTGYYLWRVRPIGNYFEGGIKDDRNWGQWVGDYCNTTTFTQSSTFSISSVDEFSSCTFGLFYYDQVIDNYNWIYNRVFTEGEEGTRIAEKIDYADGLLNKNQTISYSSSKTVSNVSEIKYDYSGRPALTTLPVPEKSTDNHYLHYVRETFKNDGEDYNPAHFDESDLVTDNFKNPLGFEITSNSFGYYYSGVYLPALDNAYVPGAGEYDNSSTIYPYSRTLYYEDGTGRVKESSGTGYYNRIGSDKTTRYYHIPSTDLEIVSVFGDEAPYKNTVSKQIIIDPNDVVTINYFNENDKILATCYDAGAPSPSLDEMVEPAGNTLNPTKITEFIENDVKVTDNTIVASYDYVSTTPNKSVTFTYNLESNTFSLLDEYCEEVCKACDYVVELIVTNLDTKEEVESASFTVSNECIGGESSTYIDVTLVDIGRYNFERRIHTNVMNSSASMTYRDDLLYTIKSELYDAFLGTSSEFIGLHDLLYTNSKLEDPDLEAVQYYMDNSSWTVSHSITSSVTENYSKTFYYVETDCCGDFHFNIKTCYICPEDLEPSDFEAYLFSKWNNTSSTLSMVNGEINHSELSDYFWGYMPNSTGDELELVRIFEIPGGGSANGKFNELISNMVSDPSCSYNLCDLYEAWVGIVDNLDILFTKDDPDVLWGKKLNKEFNLLDFFLNIVGRSYEGVSNIQYTSTPGEYGYISHAYKYFYLPGPIIEVYEPAFELVCFSTTFTSASFNSGTFVSGTYTNDPWDKDDSDCADSPNGENEWFTLYKYVNSINVDSEMFEDAYLKNQSGVEIKVEDVLDGSGNIDISKLSASFTKIRDMMVEDCEQSCDDKLEIFKQLVIEEFHSKSFTVEGDTWYYNTSGSFTEISNTMTFPYELSLEEVNCYAVAMVENCKEYCELDLTVSTTYICDPANTFSATFIGTETQRENFALVNGGTPSITFTIETLPYDNVSSTCCSGSYTSSDYSALVDGLNYYIQNYLSSATYEYPGSSTATYYGFCIDLKKEYEALNNTFYGGNLPEACWDCPSGEYIIAGIDQYNNSNSNKIKNKVSKNDYKLQSSSTYCDPCHFEEPNYILGLDYIDSLLTCGLNGSYRYSSSFNYDCNCNDEILAARFQHILSNTFTIVENEGTSYLSLVKYLDDSECTSTLTLCALPNEYECPNLYFEFKEFDIEEFGDVGSSTMTLVNCENASLKVAHNSLLYFIYSCVYEKVQAASYKYNQNCLVTDNISHTTTIEYGLNYNHYTLYYYDRAGNLVQTVPPYGVDVDPTHTRQDHPAHKFLTQYHYNSLGQMIKKKTPNETGPTVYAYNSIGQLRFSQNAYQAANDLVAYIKYDNLGRTVEVGVVEMPGGSSFATFESNVDDMNYTNSMSKVVYTTTVYTTAATLPVPYVGIQQRYLLNRVSYSYRDEDGNSGTSADRNYTYYSYDPHGNVEWVIQQVSHQGVLSSFAYDHLVSKVDYEYDLISGNVTKLSYNHERKDPYYQRFYYDEDNRIQKVETSKDNEIWDVDAQYDYYLHGPLRRVEYGDDHLQGLDYLYTIQGWLKGINTKEFYENILFYYDPSRDGVLSVNTFPQDYFAMKIGYHDNDYHARKTYLVEQSSGHTKSLQTYVGNEQFNGNIANIEYAYNNKMFANSSATIGNYNFGHKYNYDQSYRLTSSTYLEANIGTSGSNTYTTGYSIPGDTEYSTSYSYDPNGNITNMYRRRNTYSGTNIMDDQEYDYYTNTDKLNYISDDIALPAAGPDIKNQNPGNYIYDALGRIVIDNDEKILIEWTEDSKIKKITKNSTQPPYGASSYINYYYDAMGNRVSKITTYASEAATPTGSFYMRDASGNTLAIYNNFNKNSVYGFYENGTLCFKYMCTVADCDVPEAIPICFEPGDWYYDINTGKFTVYNFLVECTFPNQFYAELELIDGDIIYYCDLEIDGQPVELPSTSGSSLAEYHLYGSSAQGRFATWKPDNINYDVTLNSAPSSSTVNRTVSQKEFEVKDHLGNVRLVFSDLKDVNIGTTTRYRYNLDVRAVNNYYPFGMLMPDMSWQSSGYRYGFGGHEMDNDVKGTGNHSSFGDYGYDPRTARRYMLEPMIDEFPSLSPYIAYADNPINTIDPDGRAVLFINGYRPFRLDYRNSNLYENDYYEYWNNFDNYFMNRLGDFNATYASGHDAPLGDAQTRYETGIKAANNYIKKIKSGEVKFAETETIKIVTHSQGYAYGVGFAETLINAGYNVESFYAFAPKDPRQFSIPEEIGIAKYYRSSNDIIAFQLGGLRHGRKQLEPTNVPKKDVWLWNGNGHTIDSYYFIFKIPKGKPGNVEKRNDLPNSEPNKNKKHDSQLGPYRTK